MYSLYIYRIYFRHKKHSPPLADEKIIAQKYKLKINCEIFTIVFIVFFDFFTYFSLFLSNYIAFYRKMRIFFYLISQKHKKNGKAFYPCRIIAPICFLCFLNCEILKILQIPCDRF